MRFIRFSIQLPTASPVNISIFDISGKLIQVILDEFRAAGKHSVEWNATSLGSGIYFNKLAVGDQVAVRKSMLIK